MAWAPGAWADNAWFGTAWFVSDAVVTRRGGGGFAFMMKFEDFTEKRDEDKEKRERIQAEIKAIQDETDREIAQFLQKDIAKEAREKELKDLERLVETTFMSDKELSGNVAKAFARAAVQKNRSAMEALEREMDQLREDEEFLLIAMVVL